MKKGLLGGKLRLSSRTYLEEARLHVACWHAALSSPGPSSQVNGSGFKPRGSDTTRAAWDVHAICVGVDPPVGAGSGSPIR